MADIQISQLTRTTALNDTDVFLVRHGSVDSKILYSDLKARATDSVLTTGSQSISTTTISNWTTNSK